MEYNNFFLLCPLFLTFPRIGRYIPGIALLFDFSEQDESNAKEEVSALVAVTSADSVEVKVKFPEVHNEPASNLLPNPFVLGQS